MRNQLCITVGIDHDDQVKILAVTDNAEAALKAFENPPRGTAEVLLLRNPTPWMRRFTEEASILRDEEQKAAQKTIEEARAKEALAKAAAEKEAKAKAEKAAELKKKAAKESADKEAADSAKKRAEVLQARADTLTGKAKVTI